MQEERRALEAQITALQSQLLLPGAGGAGGGGGGGGAMTGRLEESPVFRSLLAREHTKIAGEPHKSSLTLDRDFSRWSHMI